MGSSDIFYCHLKNHFVFLKLIISTIFTKTILCKSLESTSPNIYIYIYIYYIVESEILKNTQRDIFHIFTSEDIDHVTICF